MSLLDAIVRAAALALGMAWDTWWALVLGFTVTGAVEAFVSEAQMTDYLGDDGWREVGLGTLFGAASSSCSYSAVSTTRTLFKKGASAPASLAAFQFASTDLVAELGLVMWILLGWQFVAAEVFGGVLAVALLAVVYRRYVPEGWVEAARRHARALDETECAACGMQAAPDDEDTVTETVDGDLLYFCCGGCRAAHRNVRETGDGADDDGSQDANPTLTSRAGWARAARNAMREWDMLWEDIVLGFVIAGVLAAFVPQSWWTTAFGLGAEGSFGWVLTGVVAGALVGVVTFMCSVGNVPFALVLWTSGVPFGAVLSFIFADLIIPPLVRAYRRYYGRRMAAVIFCTFFGAAVAAGVAVHYVFGGLGLVPPAGATGGTAPGGYTLVLNLALTPVFGWQAYVTFGPRRVAERLLLVPAAASLALGGAAAAAGFVVGGLDTAGSVLDRVSVALDAVAVQFARLELALRAARDRLDGRVASLRERARDLG